jgi:hypothetical protein
MFLSSVLPKERLSENAKDVIKVTMAMLATLAALVLGLLTASAKSSLDDKENAVRSWAAEALFLDRTLAQYGPEAHGARELLKEAIAARIAQLWPGSGKAVTPAKIGEGAGLEGGSIFVILEMDQPYGGFIKIRSDPLRSALEQLGRP